MLKILKRGLKSSFESLESVRSGSVVPGKRVSNQGTLESEVLNTDGRCVASRRRMSSSDVALDSFGVALAFPFCCGGMMEAKNAIVF